MYEHRELQKGNLTHQAHTTAMALQQEGERIASDWCSKLVARGDGSGISDQPVAPEKATSPVVLEAARNEDWKVAWRQAMPRAHSADAPGKLTPRQTVSLEQALQAHSVELLDLAVSLHGANLRRSVLKAVHQRCGRALVRWLIEHGANVDDTDPRSGDTALHVAARLGLPDLCQVLLDHGANPCHLNHEQHGPCAVASGVLDNLRRREVRAPASYQHTVKKCIRQDREIEACIQTITPYLSTRLASPN